MPPMAELRAVAVAGLVGAMVLWSACSPADEESTAGTATSTTTTTPATTTTTTTTQTTTTTTTSTEASPTTAAVDGCAIGPVPAAAGLDPFYTQGCQVDGFWIVANDVVDPEALLRASETVEAVFATDERLASTLTATGIRLGIIGRDQRTTEMPEYRDLNEAFPETDWDTRARGLGATLERPLVSAGEENVLCLPGDRYEGEDILLHEFSHVLHEFGYAALDPGFDNDLFAAFQQASADGTWADTYAATNHFEYWAEGVQSYLDRNLTADPADGVHGPIDTEAELRAADPALHALIDRRLGTIDMPPRCR